MFYVYVLQSGKDNGFYIGYTKDLKERVKLHKSGKVESTKNRRPLKSIYSEKSIDQRDVLHREKYLKTFYGRRYLRNRLKYYFMG